MALEGKYRPSPDFNNLLAVLGNRSSERPTLFEFYLNGPLYRRFAGALPADCPVKLEDMLATILGYKNLGYDYASVVVPGFIFKGKAQKSKASCSMNEGAVIYDRDSFEAYEWPGPDTASYHLLEEIAPFLPEGMKLVVWGPDGVFENVTKLVGYEKLYFMLMEQEDLAMDIFNEVGSRFLRYYKNCLKYDVVGAIISNDDWGFRSQALLSPDHLRRFVFPWHKKIAEATHAVGRPTILHSCGQLEEVWNDTIDEMKYDAKRSYEDAILPVEETHEKYDGRIGILGGLDFDFVCRATSDQVIRGRQSWLSNAGFARGMLWERGIVFPTTRRS